MYNTNVFLYTPFKSGAQDVLLNNVFIFMFYLYVNLGSDI